jgi:dTDP-glucose 4,6-dehydratase
MNWKDKKVLITGAGGFIGSHLTESLVTLGAQTRAFVHYNSQGSYGWLENSHLIHDIDVVKGDVRDTDSIESAISDIDIVFHLAALIAIPYSLQSPRSYLDTNVNGTLNILQSARKSEVELLVHTSTSEVYGSALYTPIDESHPLQGQSPYSASKIAADKMVEAFNLSYGLPVTTIRPFNTFGPRQLSRAVIPTIISQALTKKEIRLGNVTPTRDFNYVLDTVQGFIKISESANALGKVFNIGSGSDISIGSLAKLICDLTGQDAEIVSEKVRERPDGSEVERLCANSSNAQSILNWKQEYSLSQGLAETIEWIRDNPGWYRPDTYEI